jgi:hypothetical protein
MAVPTHKIYSSIIFFLSFTSFSQSKKEQIEILTNRVDSLNQVLGLERSSNQNKINEINSGVTKLEGQIATLSGNLTTLNKELQDSKDDILKKQKEIVENQRTISNMSMQIHKKEKEFVKLRDSIKHIYECNKMLTLVKTDVFAGHYSFEYTNGPLGYLQVYFNGKEDYYFDLAYNVGPPNYHEGSIQGVIKIYGNIGVFNGTLNIEGEDYCKIVFVFTEEGVMIVQNTSGFSCGFGVNQDATNFYYKNNSQNINIDDSGYPPAPFINSSNRW